MLLNIEQFLADEHLVTNIVKEELQAVKEKYDDERRTEIVHGEGDIDIESLIKEETNVVTLTHFGYIKRIAADTYRSQNVEEKGLQQ